MQNYVEGFTRANLKRNAFTSPESGKYEKNLPLRKGDSFSPTHYRFDEYGRKDFDNSGARNKGGQAEIGKNID